MSQLWKIAGKVLQRVEYEPLEREDLLEDWIAQDPSILGLDLLIIARQNQQFRGRVDLLGINRDGDVTIIELKRDKTPRDVVAQTLEYASWVQELSTKHIYNLAFQYLQRPLQDAFRDKFGCSLPETLNTNHSMVIVASELDESSKRIVEYLAKVHELNINTAFFNAFADAHDKYLVADWLMDQQQVVERAEEKTKAPWTGFYYVNIGHDSNRDWDDMRKYGFVAAGYGKFYSSRLFQLSEGDPTFAYQKGEGYVGYGVVTTPAVMAKDFVTKDGTLLKDAVLKQPNIFHTPDDPDNADYLVGVDWKKTFPLNEAKWLDGGFANQNIVCRLRHPATLDFLKKAFDVE